MPSSNNNHTEETRVELQKTDALLKSLPVDKYGKLATEDQLAKTVASLEGMMGYSVTVVESGAEALAHLKSFIPAGKSVYNTHSTTLEEIGFVEHFKTQTDWVNNHAKVMGAPRD